MSQTKLISIKNPIIDAQMQLGIDHDKDVMWFTRLATQAEIEIGSYYQYERTRAVVDVNGCVACLPADNVLVEIAVMGDQGEGCGDLLNMFCGISGVTTTNLANQANFLVVDIGGAVGDTVAFGTVGYEIQNNKIILQQPRDGQQMTVQYLRHMKDCDGFAMISENHVLAIKAYICLHYAIRGQNKNYIDRDMISYWKEQWDRECRHGRAEDNRLTYTQRQDAANVYTNPLTGRGLWQGMYTTLGNSYKIW